ncbi:hypothetical protein BN2476_630124 [Paraburkholderia piptadeniae]|uniref:Transposase n=1 Tax=Paraburkholderia piptadeniae TaxID=1701573 RepID=A0A1N7SLN5_9BURK|nr:hypothetical protein BN2476_630124 [Paraburkholderia piptadeniae]
MRNVIRLVQFGGYLARASDPPPSNTMMWRGMRRLTDIQFGYELALLAGRSGVECMDSVDVSKMHTCPVPAGASML